MLGERQLQGLGRLGWGAILCVRETHSQRNLRGDHPHVRTAFQELRLAFSAVPELLGTMPGTQQVRNRDLLREKGRDGGAHQQASNLGDRKSTRLNSSH